MTEEELKAEFLKCKDDLRYFYNTYWTINGKPVTPVIEEEWNHMTVIWSPRRTRSIMMYSRIKEAHKS